MCNLTPLRLPRAEATQAAFPALPAIALSRLSQPAPQPIHGRRRWTTGDLTEIVAALATLRTSDIARTLGVNPKALRSLLRRNGISLRALREHARRDEPQDGGLVVRRSLDAPSAIYGAAALEHLPDGACRWPLGDPAEPGFAFCGCRAEPGRSYCKNHRQLAFQRAEAPRGA
ncbi:GcrA family cell cycle regulator [Rhodomicrobium lacus]|uniref:GcrA family cell cycle regulator n=1 Tax=Rhodomicrobium lacus TaxID=2498452 RepID=UPI000F8C5D24|nr:GcrA family cell cycle regulator [Rhodomicrobium lacus]